MKKAIRNLCSVVVIFSFTAGLVLAMPGENISVHNHSYFSDGWQSFQDRVQYSLQYYPDVEGIIYNDHDYKLFAIPGIGMKKWNGLSACTEYYQKPNLCLYPAIERTFYVNDSKTGYVHPTHFGFLFENDATIQIAKNYLDQSYCKKASLSGKKMDYFVDSCKAAYKDGIPLTLFHPDLHSNVLPKIYLGKKFHPDQYYPPTLEMLEQAVPKGARIYIELFNTNHPSSIGELIKYAGTLWRKGWSPSFTSGADYHAVAWPLTNEFPDFLGRSFTDIIEDMGSYFYNKDPYPDRLAHETRFFSDCYMGYLCGTSVAFADDIWFDKIAVILKTNDDDECEVRVRIRLNKVPDARENIDMLVIQDFDYDHPLDRFRVKDDTFVFGFNKDEYKNHQYIFLLNKSVFNVWRFYDLPICVSSPVWNWPRELSPSAWWE